MTYFKLAFIRAMIFSPPCGLPTPVNTIAGSIPLTLTNQRTEYVWVVSGILSWSSGPFDFACAVITVDL